MRRSRTVLDSADRCRNLYQFARLILGSDLSDREIARRWGMEWRSFAALKQGRRQVPRIQELEALARLLGVGTEFVFQVAAGGSPEGIAALFGRETRLRAALDHVSDAVFTLDLRGRIQDINRRFCELAGEVEIGQLFWDLLEPGCAGTAVSAISSTQHSREVRGVEVTLNHGVPSPRLLELDVTRIDDLAGEQIGVQVIARDVTERRSMEREIETQRRTLGLIFENVPAACLLFERDGTIVAANHLLEALCGCPAKSAIGRKATEVFVNSGDWPASQALLSGTMEEDVIQLRQPDGQTRFVHRIAGPVVVEGRVEKVVEILTDVTNHVENGELRTSGTMSDSHAPREAAERRGWPRASTRLEARLCYQGAILQANIANFSPGGVFLTTDEEIPLGVEVELTWHTSDDVHQMRAAGVIAWSSKAVRGVGVRFLHVVKVGPTRRGRTL